MLLTLRLYRFAACALALGRSARLTIICVIVDEREVDVESKPKLPKYQYRKSMYGLSGTSWRDKLHVSEAASDRFAVHSTMQITIGDAHRPIFLMKPVGTFGGVHDITALVVVLP